MKLPSALVAWDTLPCISVAFSRLLTAGCIKVSHVLERLDIRSRLFPFAVACLTTILGRVFQPECQSHSFRGLPYSCLTAFVCTNGVQWLPTDHRTGSPLLCYFYPGVLSSVHDVNDLYSPFICGRGWIRTTAHLASFREQSAMRGFLNRSHYSTFGCPFTDFPFLVAHFPTLAPLSCRPVSCP